jgi:hypothetical protein
LHFTRPLFFLSPCRTPFLPRSEGFTSSRKDRTTQPKAKTAQKTKGGTKGGGTKASNGGANPLKKSGVKSTKKNK